MWLLLLSDSGFYFSIDHEIPDYDIGVSGFYISCDETDCYEMS